jgi:hypothetical protein
MNQTESGLGHFCIIMASKVSSESSLQEQLFNFMRKEKSKSGSLLAMLSLSLSPSHSAQHSLSCLFHA